MEAAPVLSVDAKRREEIERHVKALQSGDADGKEWAAAATAAEEALEKLADEDDANSSAIARRLVGLLSGGSANDQEHAAKALMHIARSRLETSGWVAAHRAAIVKAGGFRRRCRHHGNGPGQRDPGFLVAGKDAGGVAEAASKLDGVAKVLHAEADVFASPTAEAMDALVTPMMDDYDAVLAAAWVPLAYCHYGCPTGALLDYLRDQPSRFLKPADAGAALLLVASLTL